MMLRFARRPLIALCIPILVVTTSYAQSKTCPLKLADLPQVEEFFGLKLRQTTVEAKAVAPTLRMGPTDEFGRSTTSFSPGFSQRLERDLFPGVRTVTLDFVDGRIASIWIGFLDDFKWRSVDDAVSGLTEELKLPDTWHPKGRERLLQCHDFKIGVSSIAGAPSIRMVDETAIKVWDTRREERSDQPTNAEAP